MSTPLRIYFIRHGETIWSLSGRHTGHTDLALTLRGEMMARQLATTLDGIDFGLVLTSPRLRARSTCEMAGLGSAVQTEADLAEWDYGNYEGMRTAEIQALRADWDIWEEGCPGGESPAAVAARADRLIARLRDLTGNVALFSHGHFGRALVARWIGLPVIHGKRFALDPASVSILGFESGHPRRRVITLWNETSSGVSVDAGTGQQQGRLDLSSDDAGSKGQQL